MPKSCPALQPRPALNGPINPRQIAVCLPRPTSFSPIWTVSASRTRPSPIRRCSRSRRRARCAATIAGGHTKNLFLRDKKGVPIWWWRSEDAAIELESLHRLLGATGRFSFGSAELMRELLGVEPGSVTPFAVINDKAAPRHRGARCRHDGARGAQLSSAGEYRHDDDFARRGCSNSSKRPAIRRGSRRFPAAERGAAKRPDCIRPFSSHLIGRTGQIPARSGR